MENEHKECEGKDGGFGDSAVFTGRYRLQNIAFVCSHLNLLYSAYHCRFAQSYLVNSHRISIRIYISAYPQAAIISTTVWCAGPARWPAARPRWTASRTPPWPWPSTAWVRLSSTCTLNTKILESS